MRLTSLFVDTRDKLVNLTTNRFALFRINSFKLEMHYPFDTDPGTRKACAEKVVRLCLVVDAFEVIGCKGEQLFGQPITLSRHLELGKWEGGLRSGRAG